MNMRISILFHIIIGTIQLFHVFAFLPIHRDVRTKLPVRCQQQQQCSLNTKLELRSLHSDHDHENEKPNILIPVFPLRKKVKFPTETVQLTLWEERYKYLAQNVLNQQQSQDSLGCEASVGGYHTFGILYASHKPQIVRNGSEPITPILESGDVGVLCVVKEYSLFQNNVEIISETNFPKIRKKGENYNNVDSNSCVSIVKDINDWNKIKLIGLGVQRFRVEKIISRGFDGDNSPFILVEASAIDDHILDSDSTEYKEILKYKHMLEEKHNNFPVFEDINEDFQLNHPYDLDREHVNAEWRILQLWSFSILSRLETSCPAGQMLKMLSCTSLKERMQYINKIT